MADTFEDLVCWKRATELRDAVFEFTSKPPASRDFGFRDQIRDSARSAPRNIAEGFGRYYPSESAPFYRIALGSLHETVNHLIEARKMSYVDDERYEQLRRLTLRAIKATKELIRYLESPAGSRFNRPRRR